MKQYFAKYLPVEGEIKEGDKILWNGKITTAIDTVYSNLTKKVKLFLCSRSIQVGDEVYPTKYMFEAGSIVGGFKEDSNTIFYFKGKDPKILKNLHSTGNWGKVIGEISKEAIWVKEGDEFDEEEIEWICDSGDGQHISIWSLRQIAKNDEEKFEFPKGGCYAIKGLCGHFH